jgi:hypothetical protein
MSKPTVLVMRTGSAWHLDEKGLTPEGEGKDSMAVIRALKSRGYDVILAGRLRGRVEGCRHVDWNVKHGDVYWHHKKECTAECDRVVEELRPMNPQVCVNVVGQCPTLSDVNNDRDVIVQDFSAKYVLPGLRIVQDLALPRICVVNDPRQYPRDQEMNYWKHVVPAAVLSQERRIFPRKILDCRYEINTAAAGCQNWWSLGEEQLRSSRQMEVMVIAHSHFRDGRVNKKRAEVWAWILKDMAHRYVVYGKGWDGWGDEYPGFVKPGEVLPLLRTAVCGPMIPIYEGFVTAKLRQYALSGAVPLLYGRGVEWLTYDKQEHHVAHDEELRFCNPRERDNLIQRALRDSLWAKNWCDEIVSRTRPDFSMLYVAVDALAEGRRDVANLGGYVEL